MDTAHWLAFCIIPDNSSISYCDEIQFIAINCIKQLTGNHLYSAELRMFIPLPATISVLFQSYFSAILVLLIVIIVPYKNESMLNNNNLLCMRKMHAD